MTTKLQQYLDFLRNKVQLTSGGGLTAVPMHPSLFPHQRDIVVCWQNGVKYCQDAELARSAPSLFGATEETADAYEVEVTA